MKTTALILIATLCLVSCETVTEADLVQVDGINLFSTTDRLLKGRSVTLLPFVQVTAPLGTDPTVHVVWRSSNPAVATVNDDGLVTAVSVGSATITASAGGREDTAPLQVVGPPQLAGTTWHHSIHNSEGSYLAQHYEFDQETGRYYYVTSRGQQVESFSYVHAADTIKITADQSGSQRLARFSDDGRYFYHSGELVSGREISWIPRGFCGPDIPPNSRDYVAYCRSYTGSGGTSNPAQLDVGVRGSLPNGTKFDVVCAVFTVSGRSSGLIKGTITTGNAIGLTQSFQVSTRMPGYFEPGMHDAQVHAVTTNCGPGRAVQFDSKSTQVNQTGRPGIHWIEVTGR